jgi:hypothetical protein
MNDIELSYCTINIRLIMKWTNTLAYNVVDKYSSLLCLDKHSSLLCLDKHSSLLCHGQTLQLIMSWTNTLAYYE